MKRTRKLLLALAFVAMSAATLPVPSHAQSSDAALSAETQTMGASGPAPDSWVGGIAAIGCGIGIRICAVTGPNIGAIVGTVALCLYMIFDAAVS